MDIAIKMTLQEHPYGQREMEKLKMYSPDLSQDNIAKIRELFTGCVTESIDQSTGRLRLYVDFDQLKQELSGNIIEGPQERYRLDWPARGRRWHWLTPRWPRLSGPILKTA